jgi:hypothetical protein
LQLATSLCHYFSSIKFKVPHSNLSFTMDIKPVNALSAVLIEPDDGREHVAKRHKVASPDSIVSALLSLKKLPSAKLRPLHHPGTYSSFPALAPWQALIDHANRIENDHNHISDDEDADDECKGLTMMALSKPSLPSRRVDRTNDSRISKSSPIAFTYSAPPSRKRKSAHSPAPFVLPTGRPLAAAPCLPRLALGERLPAICQLM